MERKKPESVDSFYLGMLTTKPAGEQIYNVTVKLQPSLGADFTSIDPE